MKFLTRPFLGSSPNNALQLRLRPSNSRPPSAANQGNTENKMVDAFQIGQANPSLFINERSSFENQVWLVLNPVTFLYTLVTTLMSVQPRAGLSALLLTPINSLYITASMVFLTYNLIPSKPPNLIGRYPSSFHDFQGPR